MTTESTRPATVWRGTMADDPAVSDLALAHAMADAADAVTMRHAGDGGPVPSERKPDNSFVTAADGESESAMRALVRRLRPDDAFLGEEVGAFASATGNGRRWIVDGIDGTHSFAQGKPGWATMIALEVDGELVVGVITSPPPSLGQRAWAARGEGAFVASLDRDARLSATVPLRCTTTATLDDAIVKSVPPAEFLKDWRGDVGRAVRRGETPATGSFGHVQMLVAAGEIDALVQLYGAPWDFAAGVPIVTEAGGEFVDLWGGQSIDHRAVIFTNGRLTSALLAAVAPNRPASPPGTDNQK